MWILACCGYSHHFSLNMDDIASKDTQPRFTEARMQLEGEDSPSSESGTSTVSVYADVPLTFPIGDNTTMPRTSAVPSGVPTQVGQNQTVDSMSSSIPGTTTTTQQLPAATSQRRSITAESDCDPHSFFAFRVRTVVFFPSLNSTRLFSPAL